ncbi:MAG: 3-deoxy-manno-octulosonate cytidylyltransferase [bacterium]|nr:3-deoxy-manno-octulosonate cytidylyltransferase [bacterium]
MRNRIESCIIPDVNKIAIIIPARKGSTRFPGKVIFSILGKPLILWVAEGASKSKLADIVIVATDDREVMDIVRKAGFNAELTRDDHPSGTDRIWEVAQKIDADWIINLQGDEPMVTGELVDSLAGIAIGPEGRKIEMATMVRTLNPEDAKDPNRVKVVLDKFGNALYFSRSSIPYARDPGTVPEYFLHVGIYLYRKDILERVVGLEPSYLEKMERLEQLRAIEDGIKIRCVKTTNEFFGVDAPSDINVVEKALKARGFGFR